MCSLFIFHEDKCNAYARKVFAQQSTLHKKGENMSMDNVE